MVNVPVSLYQIFRFADDKTFDFYVQKDCCIHNERRSACLDLGKILKQKVWLII